MGGTAVGRGDGAVGWQRRQQQRQRWSSAAPPERRLFLAEVGQCKLPLPVGHVSERETILLRWGKSGLLCGDRKHTHTHRNRAKEAGRKVGVGESESVSE